MPTNTFVGALVAGLVAASCSMPERLEPVPTEGTSAAQQAAFAELEASTGKEWRWLQHADRGTPAHLSAARTGAPTLGRGADPVATTLGVLAERRALFRMRDPAGELVVTRTSTDELGMTHARFQQTTHGVPVVGAELTAHYDRDGHLTAIDAAYEPELDTIDVEPTVTASDASARAADEIVAATGAERAVLEPGEPTLVVAKGRLAWQLVVRALGAETPAIWRTTVDARTGAVLKRVSELASVQGSGVGALGKTQTFQVTASGNGFVMTDTTGGANVTTLTAKQLQQSPGVAITSTSATSWDTNVNGAGAAVDAHVNAALVLAYYKKVHQRNAIDGAGGALVSTVHFGQGYENAAWDGSGMIYGDGATTFKPLSAGLDVVGHEFTHGVTQATSKLVYEDQAGALNEALSDMFGCFIEHANAPDTTKNWQVGEVITKSGRPLRDLANPNGVDDPQPAHMSQYLTTQQDSGGVHYNSGIINNAGWLMTVGGTNPVSKIKVPYGLGWEKSQKLWYRANTTYFQSTTNFGQAAQDLLQAAKDLGFTANEQNIVDCAFKAVGVAQGACATITDPTVVTPTTAATGSTSSSGSAAAATSEDGSSSSGDTGAAAPVRRRAVVTTSGCSAAPSPSRSGGIFLVGTLAALVAHGARRRRR